MIKQIVISLLTAILTAALLSGITVNSMNCLEINNYFRVVLDVEEKVQDYRHKFDREKGTLMVEFPEPISYSDEITIPRNSFIRKVMVQKKNRKGHSRILFYTRSIFKVNIFPVGGLSAISPKFIITFFKKKKITPAKPVKKAVNTSMKSTPKTQKKRPRKAPKKKLNKHKYKKPIIVIDPGHGGKDPGAISVSKIYEKNIVFDIARRIKRILYEYARNDLDIYMTREKDKFIKLENRLDFADKNGADVFVSIHANASRSSKPRGIEIYYKGKATDKAAAMLQKFENSAHSTGISGFDKIRNRTVTNILIDMMQTKNLTDSSNLAHAVSKKIKMSTSRYYGGKHRGVKRAEFHVLQSIRTPSILLEVGFLTNRIDDRLLKKKWYRELLAQSISDGIITYLITSRKEHARTLKKLESKIKYKKMLTYKVKKGDTLSGIANKYDVSLREIKSLNDIKNANRLWIGQEIKVIKIK